MDENYLRHSGFIWSIAEILRGDFKQFEYGKIILPFVVLRRLDCILADSKNRVLNAARDLPESMDEELRDVVLFQASGYKVYNLSQLTFERIQGQEVEQLHQNLVDYISKFSENVRDILLDKFHFADQLKRLNECRILWNVFERFCTVDLHPDRVSNHDMGYIFEELIRKFSEISNETAGEHFTPREVIRLIVEMLLANDEHKVSRPGVIRQVYDPACGTGGMLTITEQVLSEFHEGIRVELYGQELNPESFGICKSDMLVKGHNPEQIAFGNTLTDDAHRDRRFHYILSNPPYGVDWKKYKEPIEFEASNMGTAGRFGAGTPRVSDGQLLFLQHMISKMRDDDDGTRIGIVMNGSPLFTGGAGSGESEIRRWMLENDWVECIVALPTDLFYNTGIQTYVWLLTNRKQDHRRGKVQLIDASGGRFWKAMRKSLGSKRREIPDDARSEIVGIYSDFTNGHGGESNVSRVFVTADFGYREVRVERPLRLNFQVSEERLKRLDHQKAFAKLDSSAKEALRSALMLFDDRIYVNRDIFESTLNDVLRQAHVKLGVAARRALLAALSERDESADPCRDKQGNVEPDSDLRDHEIVPFNDDWRQYFESEVRPFVADAWVDEKYTDHKDGKVGRVGYEINFNRYFYRYVPPRPLEEVSKELATLEAEISDLMNQVLP